ncbi:MAG TPA: hypothetical protein P5564_07915 [Paludibacteraceae bacterium]|nr:hypothetical protein [Paludibacteraceae bacterium]
MSCAFWSTRIGRNHRNKCSRWCNGCRWRQCRCGCWRNGAYIRWHCSRRIGWRQCRGRGDGRRYCICSCGCWRISRHDWSGTRERVIWRHS